MEGLEAEFQQKFTATTVDTDENLKQAFSWKGRKKLWPKKEENEGTRKKIIQNITAAGVSAAQVRRANQLICDQIAALEAFTGDSDAWY